MAYLQIIAGLLLLLAGGEALVRGAVAVATRLGISTMLIGLTLVGFGTSTPELVASIKATLAGAPGIAIGNVIGSNIANILLILGLSVLIFPMATNRGAFVRDAPVLIIVTLIALIACLFDVIGRTTGAVFLLLLVAYAGFSYFMDRRTQDAAARMHEAEALEVMPAKPNLVKGAVVALGGMAGVILGADLLVDGAIVVARAAGLSETVIGLTLVAVGTSLPELATSVLAAIRRHADVAFGNIVGSNIFNVLGILGTAAVVEPLTVPSQVAAFDAWVMLGVTVLLVVFAVSGWRLNRWEAAVFLVAYAAYLSAQLSPGFQAWVGGGGA